MEGCAPMNCMKCGKETEKEQVFCAHCLEVMERYPIKPGTHIQLPRREALPAQKKQNRRRNMTPEDQIVHQRVLIRTLLALLGTVSVVLGIFIGLYFNHEEAPIEAEPPIGQNYTVDSTAE